MNNHLKYKVGDRVFHKKRGWGVVKGSKEICSCLCYAVDFDEKRRDGFSCDGLCRDGHGFFILEFDLSKHDSFLNNIRIGVGGTLHDLQKEWNKLTMWGKFVYSALAIFVSLSMSLYIAAEGLPYDAWKVFERGYKKLSHIFRIYKE